MKDDRRIWTVKYSPTKLEDMILPERLSKPLFKARDNPIEMQNMLLTSNGAGSGKSSSVSALATELNTSFLKINASLERSIDLLRTDILNYCYQRSLRQSQNNVPKILLLDEFDNATPQFQEALRAFIEDYQKTTRFFFTANKAEAIIEPIFSRCVHLDFNYTDDDKKEMIKPLFKRLIYILDSEQVEYDKNDVAKLIKNSSFDIRNLINSLQSGTHDGVFSTKNIKVVGDDEVKSLITLLQEFDYTSLRNWVFSYQPMLNDINKDLYKNIDSFLEDDSSKIQYIITMNDYAVKEKQVIDRTINVFAFLLEVAMLIQREKE